MSSSSMLRIVRAACIALSLASLPALSAQAPAAQRTSTTRLATRADLEGAAAEFDRLAQSTAYSERMRARARSQAAAVRTRLAEGDFQVGDRVVLRIEGQLVLDDTATVLEGRRLLVRGLRQVQLTGVLRSELETTLRAELAEYVRTATVTARPLMRVAVFGSVGRPGYLSVPAETTVDQLLTLAGGPVAEAATNKATIQRADTTILGAAEVMRSVAEGRTLDGLGMLEGDALVVPERASPWDRAAALQILTVFIPIMIVLLRQ